MEYKENPPKDFKDQLFLEDLVKHYLEMIALRGLAEKEIANIDKLPYSLENALNKHKLLRGAKQATETIHQINWLLKDPKKY